MALETENNNLETFSDLWKKSDNDKKVEQKLRCRINDDASSEGSNVDRLERKTSVATQVSRYDHGRNRAIRNSFAFSRNRSTGSGRTASSCRARNGCWRS